MIVEQQHGGLGSRWVDGQPRGSGAEQGTAEHQFELPLDQLAHAARMVSFAQARAGRDRGMAKAERNAGDQFSDRAKQFVLRFLAENGESSSEDITDAAKAAGIRPEKDDRAFGPIYFSLSRGGLIEKAGFGVRRKGHATAGGVTWRLASAA